MRFLLRLRSLRATALGAVLSLGALAGSSPEAGAQTSASASAAYACGAVTCSSLRFTFMNTGAASLELGSLRLASANPAFAFLQDTPGSFTGGYQASDDFGAFIGATQIISAGAELFIDFTNGGFDPRFTLAVGRSGFVEVQLTAAPALQNGVFRYDAELPGDQSLRGTVTVAATSTVPEPSTYALLATGLGTLGLIARRRRAA